MPYLVKYIHLNEDDYVLILYKYKLLQSIKNYNIYGTYILR